MKRMILVGAALTAAALGAFAGPASAAADTPDGKRWYIGSGDSWGHVTWDDSNGGDDRDILCLTDHLSPSGTSVGMTVRFGSWKKSVHAYNGDTTCVSLPDSFTNGDTATFDACGWNNGNQVFCRETTKVVE